MDIDVETLLAPLEGETPCGDDLEYDPDFMQMVTDATPAEEQQVGDSVLAAEEVDFAGVAKLALGILGRSKDFRAAVYLAEASLHTDGFPAFERCLAYVDGLANSYWECAHPELDAEDDNDPTMRVNAVMGLTGRTTMLRAVRRAPLTQSRVMGRFSLYDLSIANGEIPAPEGMDNPPDSATISAAFQDTDAEDIAAIRAAISQSRAHVKNIGAVFDDKVGVDGPDLTELDSALHKAQAAINAALGEEEGSDAPDAPETDGAAAPQAAPQGASGGGAINSNDDVTRMIDRICEYYARVEPSSPVPVLLKRARRLVGADFVDIIKDMATAGYDQVTTIGGLEGDNGY